MHAPSLPTVCPSHITTRIIVGRLCCGTFDEAVVNESDIANLQISLMRLFFAKAAPWGHDGKCWT